MTTADEVAKMLEDGSEIDISDPKVIDAINQLSGDESEQPATDPEQEVATPEPVETPEVKEEPKKVLLSKDGKHEIPFGVLEQERANREAAEAAAQQLAEIVRALEAQITASKQNPEQPPQVHPLRARIDAARAEIEKATAEYPDIAPSLKANLDSVTTLAEHLYGMVQAQSEQINRIERVAVQQVQEKVNAQRNTAQEALESVPALVAWRSANPELFALASTFDNTLKVDPAWKGRPMAERFEKAVEMVVATRGSQVLEGITPTQKPASPKATTATANQRIAQALGISSLSDLPGGTAVSQDPSNVDGLSDSQLIEKMNNLKDPKDIFAFMAGAVS